VSPVVRPVFSALPLALVLALWPHGAHAWVVLAPHPAPPETAPEAEPTPAPEPAHVPAPEAAAPAASTHAPSAPPAPAGPAAKTFPRLVAPTLSHKDQFGIAVLPGTGYRVIFPYQEMINCGTPGKRVCSSRLPTFLDVQPSFGFAERWDALVDLRLGVERDFPGTRQFAVAPGARYWVDPQERSKFFTTVQVVFDFTEQHQEGVLPHNDDIALRNSNGFMFEVMRNFGAYVQFGETLGLRRWLRFEVDAGIGVQARLP
jgi:hypothetical protein